MIFYFTATGNSKYVAQRIAEKTGDKLVYMADSLRRGELDFTLADGENFGIITPTYGWGLPSVVIDFLKSAHFEFVGESYKFFVATYGTTCGQTRRMAQGLLPDGVKFDGAYSVKMPDTWTPRFDLSNPVKVGAINAAAEGIINEVVSGVEAHRCGVFTRDALPYGVAKAFYGIEYPIMRHTKFLSVSDACLSCGMCARKCPVQAIEMVDGKPQWTKEQCAMCLRCLHCCPAYAISYGKNTDRHGQYRHPNVKL